MRIIFARCIYNICIAILFPPHPPSNIALPPHSTVVSAGKLTSTFIKARRLLYKRISETGADAILVNRYSMRIKLLIPLKLHTRLVRCT